VQGQIARAATMATSATSPSATGAFVPLMRPAAARVFTARGVGAPAPSARARQPTTSPLAMRGSHLRFCASLPASRSASATRYTVDEKGIGATLRPNSSAMTHSSR